LRRITRELRLLCGRLIAAKPLLLLRRCAGEACELRLQLSSRESRWLRLQMRGRLRSISGLLWLKASLLGYLLLTLRELRVWRLLDERRLSWAGVVDAAQEGVR
jgi:hypothetical protein